MSNFDNNCVIVTGGARGLGAAIARRFAEEGAHVFVGDVLADEGAALVAGLCAAGLSASFQLLDVACEESWRLTTERIVAGPGRLDVLVNNAGLIIRKGLAATSLDEWNRAMAVNVAGVFLGMKHCRALLAASGRGAIVNISSTAGLIAHGDPSYTASKWAVRGLTKSAALELVGDGIRVNSVHPAMIATPLTHAAPEGHITANEHAIPMGRAANPVEIANIVLFLASGEASFMTGSEVTADGGMSTAGVAHMRAAYQRAIGQAGGA